MSEYHLAVYRGTCPSLRDIYRKIRRTYVTMGHPARDDEYISIPSSVALPNYIIIDECAR